MSELKSNEDGSVVKNETGAVIKLGKLDTWRILWYEPYGALTLGKFYDSKDEALRVLESGARDC